MKTLKKQKRKKNRRKRKLKRKRKVLDLVEVFVILNYDKILVQTLFFNI